MNAAAPITQLFLTIQFRPSIKTLNVLDYAAIRNLFSADFPIFNQVPRVGPMPANFTDFEFEMGDDLPRVQLLSNDLRFQLYFQDDRLTFAWVRVSPLDQSPDYPGFTAMFASMKRYYDILKSYIEDHKLAKISPVVAEVLYLDSFDMRTDADNLLPLQNIVKFYNSSAEFKFNSFSFVFKRHFNDGIVGGSETSVQGYTAGPNDEILTHLQTVVRVDLSDTEGDLAVSFFRARAKANEIFSALVKPESYAI